LAFASDELFWLIRLIGCIQGILASLCKSTYEANMITSYITLVRLAKNMSIVLSVHIIFSSIQKGV
jgi:hypothetical protein